MNSLFAEYPNDEIELLSDYNTIIVSNSTGIDSTGTLEWAMRHFDRDKILLLHCDTDLEPMESLGHLKKVSRHLNLRPPVVIRDPRGYLGILAGGFRTKRGGGAPVT